MKDPRKISENDVLYSICKYLLMRRYFFWRCNNLAVPGRSLPLFAIKGVPDIILCSEGRFYGIECKAPTGVMSEHQKEFQQRLTQSGGVYILAKSVDEVMAAGL